MSRVSTKPARVTLEDVASLAGLGRTTVSDILNRDGGDRYSAETRDRVLQAVQRLGYAPSRAAQQLARGRSGLIGLLLTRDFSNPYWARVANLIESEFRRRKFRLQLAVADGDRDAELDHLRRLHGDGVEGLIIGPVYEEKDVQRHAPYLHGQIPAVILGGRVGRPDVVAEDGYAGGILSTDHLLAMGHRRIAALAVPDADLENADRTRFSALRDRLRERRLYDGAWVVQQADTGRFADSFATAQEFAQRWLATPSNERPTAVVCHNDQVAMATLSAFAQQGIRVPDDLSVVGYDNLPESPYLVPPLTTVDNHIDRQVAEAVELLVSRINRRRRGQEERLIQPTLVERGSVKRLA